MPAASRISPVWLVLTGILSVQVGAAIAKSIFGEASPTTLVWLRLLTSALVLLPLSAVMSGRGDNPRGGRRRRPPWRGAPGQDWLVVLAFGVCLALMNWAFYNSFARIPLGIAVMIEFLGPLAVAVLGSRRPRDLIWVLLAGAGVALLGFSRARLDWVGVAFGLLAGVLWAGYILLSKQTGRRWPGLSGLAVASLVGVAVLAGPVVTRHADDLLKPHILLLGAAIGLMSSVIPYSLELIALRRMPARVFGILMSLEPAAAAIAAMFILSEFLAPTQWLAVGCVVAASVGATRTAAVQPD